MQVSVPMCTVCGHALCPLCGNWCDKIVKIDGEMEACPCFETNCIPGSERKIVSVDEKLCKATIRIGEIIAA